MFVEALSGTKSHRMTITIETDHVSVLQRALLLLKQLDDYAEAIGAPMERAYTTVMCVPSATVQPVQVKQPVEVEQLGTNPDTRPITACELGLLLAAQDAAWRDDDPAPRKPYRAPRLTALDARARYKVAARVLRWHGRMRTYQRGVDALDALFGMSYTTQIMRATNPMPRFYMWGDTDRATAFRDGMRRVRAEQVAKRDQPVQVESRKPYSAPVLMPIAPPDLPPGLRDKQSVLSHMANQVVPDMVHVRYEGRMWIVAPRDGGCAGSTEFRFRYFDTARHFFEMWLLSGKRPGYARSTIFERHSKRAVQAVAL